ncbi:serine/arginine repetitive matrix protein 2-like [Palaemon carinicauda]|uniref:serine/arginine repetitive matrix protein 2-like n=1 Tax=Palaemon carinicauda TaxID=392227 RepID=UPI0035B5B246
MEHSRLCSGPRAGKSCGAFLSKPDVDPHSLCTSCRGKACSQSDTCPECADWSEVQWVKFGTKKKKALKRSPRKTSLSSPATSAGEGSGSDVVGESSSSRADQAPVSECSGGPRDVALSRRGRVSTEDPMWSNNVPFSSPDYWVEASGASATEGAVCREESPQEDPLAWDVPRMPMRSPLDMEEGLSEAFPFMARSSAWLPAKPSVPENFLLPSTSGVRRSPKKPPSGTRSRYGGESDSSGRDSSGSSSEERRRCHRRKRDRSVRRNSLSRSPTGSRDKRSPRSPPSKSRRPSSPQGAWVFVPSNKLKGLSKTSSLLPERPGDSPPRRASKSLARESAGERRASSCRHKSRPRDTQSAQRRESSPRMGILYRSPHRNDRRRRAPPSNYFTEEAVPSTTPERAGDSPPRRSSKSLARESADERGASSCRPKSRPRDTQAAQRRESSPRMGSLDRSPHRDDRQGRAPPSNYFTEEPVPSTTASRKKETSDVEDRRNRGSRQYEGVRDHASPQRRMEEVDGETTSATEDSAYRRVLSLIRGYNSLVEPVPQEEAAWTSGLNKFLAAPAQKKSSLSFPEARNVGIGKTHIDRVIARNSDSSRGYSTAKLLQGLKSQTKYSTTRWKVDQTGRARQRKPWTSFAKASQTRGRLQRPPSSPSPSLS